MTHALALKGDVGVALLWFIGTTEFAGLTISSYEGWTMKIRLPETDHLELKKRLIQHGVLVSYWDPNQLSQKIGILTKKEYVEAQMQFLPLSEDLILIEKMLDDGHFPFTYNGNKITKNEEDFPEPEWTVYDFSCNEIVAVKAQIYFRNFKTSIQPYADCDYLFPLQGIYAFLSIPVQIPTKQQINQDLTLCVPYMKKSKIV